MGRANRKQVGELFESCNGYLVRAFRAGKSKWNAQIQAAKCSIIEYGWWDTREEALEWARAEARYNLPKIPPLFQNMKYKPRRIGGAA